MRSTKCKKSISLLVIMFALICLSACRSVSSDEKTFPNAETPSETETQLETEPITETEETTEAATEPTTETEINDPGQLSEEELKWFNTEFFNGDDNHKIQNRFLLSEYAKPEDVSLYEVFREFRDGSGSRVNDEAQLDLLLAAGQPDAMHLDVFRVTTDELNQVLQENVGIDLEACNKVELDMLTYLEEYDAYYSVCGDTHYKTINILDGTCEEDIVTLQYTLKGGQRGEVVLQKVDDGYHFLSNQYEIIYK